MASTLDCNGALECIEMLARDIAQTSPDCAEKAMQIVYCVRDLRAEPDRAAVSDAIELSMLSADVSESQLQTTTSAVVGALKRSPL